MRSANPDLHVKPDDPLRLNVAAARALTAGVAISWLTSSARRSHPAGAASGARRLLQAPGAQRARHALWQLAGVNEALGIIAELEDENVRLRKSDWRDWARGE